jgi:hypothetical protein
MIFLSVGESYFFLLLDLYFFGTVAHLIATLMFVYFVWDNYEQAVQQPYISITSSGADCNTVPITVTGNYLADYNGNWAGTPAYEESKALYSLSLSNFQVSSPNQYVDMMRSFYTNLAMVGVTAKENNLPTNLVYWMTYTQYYYLADPQLTNFTGVGYGQLQTLQLTADPSVVFNLLNTVARFSSVSGVCPIESYTTYDESNHNFNSLYSNYSAFVQSALCREAVNPFTFGYSGEADGNYFPVDLHVQALAVALGVNYGIVPMSTLRVISQNVGNFTFGLVEYTIGEYFDVRYPSMQSLFCVTNSTPLPFDSYGVTNLCVMTEGTTFAAPVFNHVGESFDKPTYCACQGMSASSQSKCSRFEFLPGLVFYRTDSDLGDQNPAALLLEMKTNATAALQKFGLFNLLAVLQEYPDYQAFNKAAYEASFITASSNYTCDQDCLNAAWDFCRVPGNSQQNCSLLILKTANALSSTVSEYKYQLENGSCTASMVVPEENW